MSNEIGHPDKDVLLSSCHRYWHAYCLFSFDHGAHRKVAECLIDTRYTYSCCRGGCDNSEMANLTPNNQHRRTVLSQHTCLYVTHNHIYDS